MEIKFNKLPHKKKQKILKIEVLCAFMTSTKKVNGGSVEDGGGVVVVIVILNMVIDKTWKTKDKN